MGDEAEGIFDRLYPKSAPWGLNRPPFPVTKLHPNIRQAPDRIMRDCLVECMGFGNGRDKHIKLKKPKLVALEWWNQIQPTYIFFWDRVGKRHTVVHVGDITHKAIIGEDVFDRGQKSETPYWKIDPELLSKDWSVFADV
jgi:hypothetical protein